MSGKGSNRRPGTGYAEGYDRLWGRVDADDGEIKPPGCGDCGGSLVVEGGPCPACAPTEDGPGEDAKQ